jgi:hypothetical protein
VKLWSALFVIVLALNVAAFAGQEKEKEKVHEGTLVDSGSFGIFMGARRVGTETFSIYQNNGGSVIESEFTTQGDKQDSVQRSEMHLTANGEIKRYDWKELSPGKASFSVIPNDQFLTQKWNMGPDDKEHEQPYLLAPSTSILDDYSFVDREVLAWKFLASACKQDKGQVQCPVRQRAKFPTMNPHEHSSAPATMEFLGREKLTLRGAEHELNKLELKSASGTWLLWLDDQFKLQRILIAEENTEVIRD